MDALLKKCVVIAVCFCVATLIAQVSGITYLRLTGRLDDTTIAKLANLLGKASQEPTLKGNYPLTDDSSLNEETSFEERDAARDLAVRNLELREQSIKACLDRILYEKDIVVQERGRFELAKKTFKEQLAVLRDETQSNGRENVRLTWEHIKPTQAKQQIIKMLDVGELNEVVTILSSMPVSKRAKIVSEFKTSDEVDRLDEILHEILEGAAEAKMIEETDRLLQPRTALSNKKRSESSR